MMPSVRQRRERGGQVRPAGWKYAWVSSLDYGETPAREVDPAPLVRLVSAWYDAPGDPVALRARTREVAEDAADSPIHLTSILGTIEAVARRTGGSLTHATSKPGCTAPGDRAALHYLLELLHAGSLRAAADAVRTMEEETRFLVLEALRPYWQAPLTTLCTPLRDGDVMPHQSRLWRA